MRVLVVEDEPDLREAVRTALRRDGYVVDQAADGHAAVGMCLRVPYDMVVLDLTLPGLDGLEVCAEIRRGARPPLVLMLTARDAVDDRVAGLDAGADDYLVKPFDLRELLARLRALARRDTPARARRLTVGDLQLDPAARRAWTGQGDLDLTAKEWTLLHYLMRRADAVVSTEELLEHVWDDAMDPFTNAVRVQIGGLRKKIGRDRIETVVGLGYRLTDPSAAGRRSVSG